MAFVLRSEDLTASTRSSCGTELRWYEAKVVDDHRIHRRADHSRKEPWLMKQGYLGMPEASWASWRNGWFHTGDAVYQDENGRYYFHDRIKDAIGRRGENISCSEVEAVVNTYRDVIESAVIGVPSDLGEDDVMVVVVVENSGRFVAKDLHDFLVQRLPRFAIPRHIRVVQSLDKTPGGKTRKMTLGSTGLTADTWDAEAKVPDAGGRHSS